MIELPKTLRLEIDTNNSKKTPSKEAWLQYIDGSIEDV